MIGRLRTEVAEFLADRGVAIRELRWGIAGVVITVLGLAAAAVIYAVPFGEHTYTADFRISGDARPGDEVRVAGIEVGQVRSVRLARDHVEIRFGVDRSVRVGDQTTAEVKLLTPIGGHYLSLQPRGGKPLGGKHIPPEHTTTPFELNDIVDATTPKLADIDGATLRATVAEVRSALDGQPAAIRNLLDNVGELSGVLADRSRQLNQALRVSDEYVGAIAADRAVLADFVRQLGVVAVTLGQRKADMVRTFNLLRRLFDVLHRPLLAYGDSIEPAVTEFEQIVRKVFADPARIDTVVTGIREFVDKISQMLGPGGATVAAPTAPGGGPVICIPYQGKVC
ncbi:MCE family protein [Nocardia pseudobrasiliensis]|uniref:Phospholipid/cholesterol/gamma-HCH transport system substrate-binding protein n=1 Tax=Nocardia pseudobrasiliensis TaxID=45979 RepID=A0A370IB40_9NOCA|nr:MCE family protein [Nocardia pseudobrasiliensis]RDI67945.1 phospholipid/cholesterol/gamma-HCH transport system substrate-binding protein [Nocardia pseudobrasiliensis]